MESPAAPRRWLWLAGWTTLYVLLQPGFTILHYGWNHWRGAYPTHADSIAIPIHAEIMGWALIAPVFLLLIWWGLWKSKGPWLRWNPARPVWSSLWTLFFALLGLLIATEIPPALLWMNVPTVVNAVLGVVLVALLQKAIVSR